MRLYIFAALSFLALAPALTGCDALTGSETASAAPTANNGYFGSGHRTDEPCDGGGGTIGSGTDQECTPDPE